MSSSNNFTKSRTDIPMLFKKYSRLTLQSIAKTFNRFPLTLLLFICLAGLIIYRIETPYEKLKDINTILDRISAVLALGIPISLCISLLIERLVKTNVLSKKILFSILQIAFLYLYFYFFFPSTDMVPMIRLLLLSLALSLSFLFIPYLPRKENFEIYILNLITKAATTAFYTIALGLGIMAILFAIKSLLYSEMSSNLYQETWIVVWLIFAPLHFLDAQPSLNDTFTVEHFNKVIKIMLLYIALPIITAYTIVLYIYFGKIIITQVWPKGIVSYLVVSYTAAGISAVFLTSSLKDDNKWVQFFTTVFTKLIFPLLIMMFISIGIRIGEFGFTENRYFILIIGLWSTLIMIFLNFDKGKRNIILPVTLAIVAFLTVCGPWSAFDVSTRSQNNRFFEIISKYDMLQNGKIATSEKTVDIVDQREITGILQYFQRQHKLSELKYLPAGFEMSQMKNVFGFSEVYLVDKTNNYFYYGGNKTVPISISGYNYLFRLGSYKYQPENGTQYEQVLNTSKGRVKLVLDGNNTLTFFHNDIELYQYDLQSYFLSLYNKYVSNLNNPNPSNLEESIIVTDETSAVKIMIIFYNINGTVSSDKSSVIADYIEGDVLLTIK